VGPIKKGRRGLVDDHILFREGLSRLLTSEPDFAIAGNCGTSQEVLQILQDTRVEMILLDFDIGIMADNLLWQPATPDLGARS